MIFKNLKILIIISFIFLPLHVVLATNYLDVVINEVAWMGSEVSYTDEWIELRNMTSQDIDVSGWIIENASKKNVPLEIPREGKHTLPSNGYYLISYYSMADNVLGPKTIINTITDWRVKGMAEISLANNYKDNGQLKLRDTSGTLIDQTPSPDNDWPAGDNKTKQTMERTNSGDWQNSQDPNGTPRAKNSIGMAPESPPSPPEAPPAEPILQTEPKIPSEPKLPQRTTSIEPVTYSSGILINEVLPSPEGSDSENEYIELKNTNSIEIDLSGWKIRDTIGSSKTYTFPAETKIKANGYLVIMRPTSKITLNNDGDGLELKNPAEEIVDTVNFGKASLGQSYNRTDSDWIWSTTPTPEKANIITGEEVTPQPKKASNLVENKNQESTKVEVGSREVKLVEELERSSKVSVIFVGFLIALCSAIAFLIIKNNLKNFWY